MKLIMFNRHVLINELPILYHEKELIIPGVSQMSWLFDDAIVWSEVRL